MDNLYNNLHPQVHNLLNTKQYAQRTEEWYEARKKIITASAVADLLLKDNITCDSYVNTYNLHDSFIKDKKCCNPYSSKTKFILSKCEKHETTFKGNMATFWGQKYEPIISDIYSLLYSTSALEFGLIKHPTIDWLGASPDFITPGGIMGEIKAPFRRKIIGVPTLYYWIQVQIQLEVCDLEYCDFIEYEFIEFLTEYEFLDEYTLEQVNEVGDVNGSNRPHFKGLYFEIINESDLENKSYIYPPKELYNNLHGLLQWRNSIIYENKNIKIIPIYWKTLSNSIVRILRDRDWFIGVKPILEKNWNEVLYYKKDDNYKKLLTKNNKTYHEGESITLDLNSDKKCIFN